MDRGGAVNSPTKFDFCYWMFCSIVRILCSLSTPQLDASFRVSPGYFRLPASTRRTTRDMLLYEYLVGDLGWGGGKNVRMIVYRLPVCPRCGIICRFSLAHVLEYVGA